MNDSVLIDTSLWVYALRRDGNPDLKSKVNNFIVTGKAAWCEMILLELWNGARGDEEKNKLKFFEQGITLLPITADVWKISFQLARAARASGLTVPNADLLIAACGRFYNVSIEHFDNHFLQLEKLKLSGLS